MAGVQATQQLAADTTFVCVCVRVRKSQSVFISWVSLTG